MKKKYIFTIHRKNYFKNPSPTGMHFSYILPFLSEEQGGMEEEG